MGNSSCSRRPRISTPPRVIPIGWAPIHRKCRNSRRNCPDKSITAPVLLGERRSTKRAPSSGNRHFAEAFGTFLRGRIGRRFSTAHPRNELVDWKNDEKVNSGTY